MISNLPENFESAPHLKLEPILYRALLRVTRRHGMFTIARNHVRRHPLGQIFTPPAGGRMFIPPDPHFIGFLTGLHEEHITQLLRKVIEPGSLCLDVGANIGYFSVMMSALSGSPGCVYAFEPERGNFSILEGNSKLVNPEAAPIIARKVAISDECGLIHLVAGEESTLHQVTKAPPTESSAIPAIPSISIDSLSDEIGDRIVTLLKIDVEGHELPAILGARNLIQSRRIKNIVIEVTPGEDASRLEPLLSKNARLVRIWEGGRWIERPLSGIQSRTDVWVQF